MVEINSKKKELAVGRAYSKLASALGDRDSEAFVNVSRYLGHSPETPAEYDMFERCQAERVYQSVRPRLVDEDLDKNIKGELAELRELDNEPDIDYSERRGADRAYRQRQRELSRRGQRS